MVRIDKEKAICIVDMQGTPTVSEVQEEVVAMLAHPDHVDGMDEIWDFRQASPAGLVGEDLQGLAEFVHERLDRLATRLALVLGNDLSYEVARMWDFYAGNKERQQRRFFRTMEEAIDWLAP